MRSKCDSRQHGTCMRAAPGGGHSSGSTSPSQLTTGSSSAGSCTTAAFKNRLTLSCRQGTAKAALERTCSRLHACLSTQSCSGWSRVLSWEACLSHSEQALTRHAALAGKGSSDQGWFPVAAVRPCPEHSSQRLPCLQRRQPQLDCTVSVEAHDLAQQSHMMVKEAVHPARPLGHAQVYHHLQPMLSRPATSLRTDRLHVPGTPHAERTLPRPLREAVPNRP